MTTSPDVLSRIYDVIASRRGADPDTSYVAKLYKKGRLKMAEKIGEEATETVIAALAQGEREVVSESADLIFHLMVLWADMGIVPEQIYAELARREGTSGISEKASRKL